MKIIWISLMWLIAMWVAFAVNPVVNYISWWEFEFVRNENFASLFIILFVFLMIISFVVLFSDEEKDGL